MTERYSFNLVDEPWIPCLRLDGEPVELSLRDALVHAQELQMVAAELPHTTAALMRLLLAILHRVFGPADEDAWAALWTAQRFDAAALDAYFQMWRHRFDLFDPERPFYQMDDPKKQFKSVVSLKHGFSFLHDEHFDHTNEASGFVLTPQEAARCVVTVQVFGLSGTSGPTLQFTGAPGLPGATFMLQGDNLKETIVLNMPAYPEQAFFVYVADNDAPIWEQDDPFSDERDQPYGLLDYVTWQNRWVLLDLPDLQDDKPVVRRYKVGPGPRLRVDGTEPYFAYQKSKKGGMIPIRFSEERSLWRDSVALFSIGGPTKEQYQSPTAFRWLSSILESSEEYSRVSTDKQLNCLALGISRDPGNVAKVLFARLEHLPIVPAYLLEPDLVQSLSSALSDTEKTARSVLRAVRVAGMHIHIAQAEQVKWPRYGIHLKASQSIHKEEEKEIEDWVSHAGVERAYWASLDVPFQEFVVRLPADREGARIDWQQTLEDAAYAAFDKIALYAGDDGRSLKALVVGRQALAYSLRQDLPLIHQQVEQQPTAEEVSL